MAFFYQINATLNNATVGTLDVWNSTMDDFSSTGSLPHTSYTKGPTFADVIRTCVCIIGIVLNLVSIIAILHIPHDRWCAYIKLIINLAVSDSLVLLSVIFHNVLDATSPGDCTDMIKRTLLNIALTSTLFNLVFMATDHYLAFVYASKYDRWLPNRRVNIAIVGLWVTCVICSVFEISFSVIGYNKNVHDNWCRRVNMDSFNFELIIVIFIFVVLLCLIVIYARICHIVKSVIKTETGINSHTSHSVKAITTTFLIIGTFAFCWCPLGMYHIILYVWFSIAYLDNESLITSLLDIQEALLLLLLLNTICDPVIYAVRRTDVKLGYRRLCRRILHRRIERTDLHNDRLMVKVTFRVRKNRNSEE